MGIDKHIYICYTIQISEVTVLLQNLVNKEFSSRPEPYI